MSNDVKQKDMKVDIILSDGFVMTELSGVVDVLRLANRVVDKKLFFLGMKPLSTIEVSYKGSSR